MQNNFAKLRQALQDPADGPYALIKMRERLIEALRDFPAERYQVADLLLAQGRPISQNSRRVIGYLIEALENNTIDPGDILDLAEMLRLMYG